MRDHPLKDPNKKAPQGRKPSKFWRLPFNKREFVRHFLACDMDEVEAARRSHWKDPAKDGPRLLKSASVQEAIEEQGKDLNLMSSVGPEETRRRMSLIARDPLHPAHYKALETLGRWHGFNEGTLRVDMSKSELLTQALDLLDKLSIPQVKGEIVEAEYTSNTVPQLVEVTSGTE